LMLSPGRGANESDAITLAADIFLGDDSIGAGGDRRPR